MKSPKISNQKKELLKALKTLWVLHPDLRFFQLLELVSSKLTFSIGNSNNPDNQGIPNLFYIKDKTTLKELKKLLKELK